MKLIPLIILIGSVSGFAQSDTQSPNLVGFDFTPKAIDTGDGSATITFTTHLTDDVSGIFSGGGTPTQVRFKSPSGQQNVTVCFDGDNDLVLGSRLDGVFVSSETLPQYSESGTWQLVSFMLVDQVDNRRELNKADLEAQGFPTEFEVVSQGDVQPPILAGLEFTPKTIDAGDGSATITFTAHLTDDVSGIFSGGGTPTQVRFKSPSGQQSVTVCFDGDNDLVTGSRLDGVFVSSETLPQYSESGTWQLISFMLFDQVENRRELNKADLEAQGFPTEFEVADESTFTLIVNSGSGDGEYAAGIVQTITADAAPSGQRFDQWTGDTLHVADIHALTTTVTMPALDVTVTATYEMVPTPPAGMVFVSISEPEFIGRMSRYETTNAQYCQYLNEALAIEIVTVHNGTVYATSDVDHSRPYFQTVGANQSSQIMYSGSSFSVRSRDGYSMANHPVVMVSWYGATAFADYYGYRLPTEWEWQAVADYDGSYTYGCGTTIDQTKANCREGEVYANPLGLTSLPYTSPVNHYSTYGYGLCDMAGNVWEWTSSVAGNSRVFRGSSWYDYGVNCTVAFGSSSYPNSMLYNVGFRVCRAIPTLELELVSISDPGVPGHEGFAGKMGKYETTNAQYCQFLNAALADGLITVYNNRVHATSDTSYSEPYFDPYPGENTSQITYDSDGFSVRTRDGHSMADHPVVEVSWYGATAFADYYGYRLPTEWEWQAVADYDGSYSYGCGTTIDQTKANYLYIYASGEIYANPLGLTSYPYTSPVGHYPAYGYGLCDVAGNVWEWTSTVTLDGSYERPVLRGGSWYGGIEGCSVSHRYAYHGPSTTLFKAGFRVCSGTRQYALTVNGGTGDGSNVENEILTITADAAPEGHRFDQWTGDVSHVADVYAETTTMSMPATDVNITATYAVIAHAVDADGDSAIGDFELLDYIDQWAAGHVGDFALLDCIDLWAAGHYYWDEGSRSLKPGYE